MTAQEVIKNFMDALNIQNYGDAISALDDAIRKSSRFDGIQDAIDNFLDTQKTVERNSIKTILGNNYKEEYDGLQLQNLLELAETDTELAKILSTKSTYSDTPTNYGRNRTFTATERIRMLTADTFLSDYCGVILERYCFPIENTYETEDGETATRVLATYYINYSTGNVDTGAITGKDAGGETVKTSDTIVLEIGNKYTAKTSAPQIINVGNNDWIVQATDYNDTIISGGTDSINAGGSADVILVNGDSSTILSGEDNASDKIYISSNTKTVNIANLESNDVLNISGDFKVSSAILKQNTVTITNKTGERVFTIANWTTAKNSKIIVEGETSAVTIGKWLSDFIEYEETTDTSTATATVSTETAVTVNLEDVTDISGSFSFGTNSNDAIFNSDSTSGEVGEVSSDFPNVTSFTAHGLKVELWGRSRQATSATPSITGIKTLTLKNMTDDEKTIFAGIYKWWIKEGLKLIEESFGLGFNTAGVNGNNIKVFFFTNEDDKSLALVNNSGSGNNLELGINMAHFAGISSDDVNGTGTNTLLDRTIAHELTHAVMAANIKNSNLLPQFISEGLAELVHGIDDERVTRVWELAGAATDTSRISTALNLSSGTGNGDCYAGGYLFLRYFAKQAAEQTSKLPALGDATVNVSLTSANATYYANLNKTSGVENATTAKKNYVVGTATNKSYEISPGIKQKIYTNNTAWEFIEIGSNNSVISGNGNDTVYITAQNNFVSVGSGANQIYLYDGSNNTISSGSGKDYIEIFGGADNKITSGKGNDTIYFGNNATATITDFSADDVIYLENEVSEATFENGVLSFGNVKLTLENVSDISKFAGTKIINGDEETTLGNLADLTDITGWTISGSTAKFGDLITITGLSTNATENDLSLSGTTVTISANALDSSKTVEISDGYTLALASDVEKPETIKTAWNISNGTANYNSGGKTAGYILSDNQIIYQAETVGDALITVSGLSENATVKNISLSGTTVKISANALDTSKTVTISDGYKLALNTDVTVSKTTAEGWQVSKGAAEYKNSAVSAGFAVSDNKIIYVDETAADTLITVTGLKTTAKATNLSLAGNSVTIAAAAVNKGKVTITDGYALTLAKGTYTTGATISGGDGVDTITNNGNNLIISANDGDDFIYLGSSTSKNTIIGGAGNDTISAAKGKNIYRYATGDGDDIINGFTENDTLNITSGNIDSWTVANSDLIFNVGDGSITIKDGVNKKINTAIGKNKAISQIYSDGVIYNDKKTAVTIYNGNYSASISSVVTIDGAAADSVEIIGNSKNNLIHGGEGSDSIFGGSGNDTIYGGAGSDYISGDAGNDKIFGEIGEDTLSGGAGNDTLTGGDGEDVFIYSGGNDVISDYTEEDKISIASGEISSISISSKDVILKINKNTLKIKNGVSKKITINDETKIYEKGKIYDGDKISVTLTAAVTETLSSSIINVDGSNSSGALKLRSNENDNLIHGGKGGDSILGGGGNDTIFGNAGADKLFGGEGNDVLDGGAGNDTLTGGAGNDTLTGGDGNDIFIFENGNDFITDYTTGKDKIKFSAEITNYSINGNNVIFETAEGTLTVADGAGKIITVTDYKNKTTKQNYAATNSKTLDLICDNNFMNDDTKLDSITEQKFDVQNIETQNYSNLENNETILTYSEEK